MNAHDLRNLFLLAAIWGGSFLFMSVAVSDFGAWPLMLIRVGVAALALWAVIWWQKKWDSLCQFWRPIAFVGVVNAAIPFTLYAYAAHYLPTGTMAVINAMTPLFGALIARIWLHEHLSLSRFIGLIIGFSGIIFLVYEKLFFADHHQSLAVLASIIATCSYGVAASFSTKYLKGADSIAVTTGSLTSATLCILPFALWYWPTTPISATSWGAALALALLCTSVAYVIFYRLIATIGGAKSVTVTFLVPPFGIIWGVLLLGETFGLNELLSTAFVLLGTLLATGFLQSRLSK
ncbi:DMT family transporter [uncultured Paenalcaligenes sp.]|uniref:DMT family transporter n=1 Tax=uncultured Paenalcaligenes sp. TaxID=1588925 RepID=UPI0026026814|nr:DMT family transporter [uncultured Paenalcaligenes sp.]